MRFYMGITNLPPLWTPCQAHWSPTVPSWQCLSSHTRTWPRHRAIVLPWYVYELVSFYVKLDRVDNEEVTPALIKKTLDSRQGWAGPWGSWATQGQILQFYNMASTHLIKTSWVLKLQWLVCNEFAVNTLSHFMTKDTWCPSISLTLQSIQKIISKDWALRNRHTDVHNLYKKVLSFLMKSDSVAMLAKETYTKVLLYMFEVTLHV